MSTLAVNNHKSSAGKQGEYILLVVVFLDDEAEESVRAVVAEQVRGCLEFININEATSVLAERLEASAPVLNILQQPSELGVVYLVNKKDSWCMYTWMNRVF